MAIIIVMAAFVTVCAFCRPMPPVADASAPSILVYRGQYGDHLTDSLALQGGILRALPSPFLSSFDECMERLSVHPTRSYGPLPSNNSRVMPRNVTNYSIRSISGFQAGSDVGGLQLPSKRSIKAFLRTANRSSPLLLHAFSNVSTVAGMLTSWVAHTTRVSLMLHVLFVGHSSADCNFVARWAPCIVHASDFETRRAGSMTRAKKGMAVDTRWVYTWLLVHAGLDVVLIDADAFLLSESVLTALQQSTFLVQGLSDRDYEGNSILPYCGGPDALCQSTAFTYFRAHPLIEQELYAFVVQLDRETGWEQELWQAHASKLQSMGVYSLLDRFGNAAFANWNVFRRSIELRIDIQPMVLHMGYIFGSAKQWTYICAQLWFYTF
jgi:hypothetical protein